MYLSPYPAAQLAATAAAMRALAPHPREAWCVFDNTALGEATKDALGLLQRLGP